MIVIVSHAILDVDRTTGAKTDLHLISGNATITDESAPRHPAVSLTPGQFLTIDPATPVQKPVAGATSSWPTGAIDVDDMTLSDLTTAANRYSTTQIVLSSPGIAALRVSGRFRINDTVVLAQRLALLFDLRVDKISDGRLLLTRT